MIFDKLNTTSEEDEFLEWCYGHLDEEDLLDAEEEALEIATPTMNACAVGKKLRSILVEVLVRTAREQQDQENSSAAARRFSYKRATRKRWLDDAGLSAAAR